MPQNQFTENMVNLVPPAWDGQSLLLQHVSGALAVCSLEGDLLGATNAARALLGRFQMDTQAPVFSLPPALWQELSLTPLGESLQWRPAGVEKGPKLGCTRYRLGDRHLLLVMRELSDQHADLSKRLHEQRLEVTGRLVAAIAHDLRTPLASIIYNTDFVISRHDQLSRDLVLDSLAEVKIACQRMKRSIDGFLDFARLGVPHTSNVSLREVCDRVMSLLRPTFRDGGHSLSVSLPEEAAWVQANPITLEQILVNLVLNAIESAPRRVQVVIHSKLAPERTGPQGQPMIGIFVQDNGDGIVEEIRGKIFEPFFSSKANAIGLGLTMAREAVAELGGLMSCESTPGKGTQMALYLIAGAAASDE
ncbi:MAG: HAMP domain-containing histidine kinase [Blastocatellia bacterium]|nr:HAMP domain-containing histidine kinase [Blastocatellia bacterium]